jgi:hypothetical protein
MPDSEPKRKMLSIRLSDVEYDAIKAHLQNYGARNASDLARLALQRIMSEAGASPNGFAARLAELEDRVHTLESRVALMPQQEQVMSAGSRVSS